MRSLAFVLFVLVGSLILTNIPTPSYADPNLDTLLRITTQARDNINIQLSQLTTVPDEINQLYKQGSEETDALAQSISQNDQTSSKEHFLSAMKIFKEVNDKISSITPSVTNEQPTQIDTLQLKSEINRIQTLGDRLKTIAATNNVTINFTKFNEALQDARQSLNASNVDQINKDLETANQFLLDAHQLLADAATKETSDRAKDFTEKQVQRLSQIKETNSIQNVTRSFAPLTSPIPQITNESQTGNIPNMIIQLKQLVSDGKIDEALKLIKLIEAIQNQQVNSQTPTTNTSNTTQSITPNSANETQNSNIVSNPSHINSENRSHEKRDNQTQSITPNSANETKNLNPTKNVNAVNNQHKTDNKNSHKETNSKNHDLKKIRTNNSED